MASNWTDTNTAPSFGVRAKAAAQRAREEAHRQYLRAQAEWHWGGFFRWFGIAFGGGIAVMILVLIFMDWNTMRGPVSRFASARLGREVHIDGNLNVHLFSWTPTATAGGIRIGNPNWLPKSQMGSADKLTIRVKLMSLFFGPTIYPLVEVERPNVALVRDKTGRANWDFSGNNTTDATAFKLPPINRFIVNDGKVTLQDAKGHMTFDGAFSSHETIKGKREDVFVLDGKGTLRGAPLTASVRGGPLLYVDPNKPYALNVDLHHGGTHVVATGALDRPFDLNHFSAATKLSGPSLADLYFLTGLAMPNTAPYRLSSTFIRDGKFYRLAKLHGTVGKSDLFGEMSVDTSSGRPFLKANLESKSLAFSDLGPMIGSTPGQGTAVRVTTASGATTTVVSNARVLPDMPLRVERVRGMDGVIDYKADTIRSQDFPLRQLLLHLTLDHGVMAFNPIAFTFPQGKLSGKATIDARGPVPINDVDARITDIQLAQFFGGPNPLVTGTMEARAKLHAAGDSIHKAAAAANGTFTMVIPHGTVRKAYADLTGIRVTPGLFELLGNDKTDTTLRCGVAHFTARNGSLVSEQLVMDTDAVQIRGHGTVNLDTEAVNFSIQGQPKSFTLLRVRAPITVHGTLGSPSFGINAGSAIAQGGVAAALSFLNPIAAILPFVDGGLSKDANCAALLSGAKAQGAPVKAKAIRNAAPVRK